MWLPGPGEPRDLPMSGKCGEYSGFATALSLIKTERSWRGRKIETGVGPNAGKS